MTYTQAQMIVHNPDAYSRTEVKQAIAIILANLAARPDDVTAAMLAA